MRNRPETEGKKVTIFGLSRGGEAALLVAEVMCSEVKYQGLLNGVIAYRPSDTVWGDRANGIWLKKDYEADSKSQVEVSSWTYKGVPRSFLPMAKPLQELSVKRDILWEGNTEVGYEYAEAYKTTYSSSSKKQIQDARIKTENINVPLLVTTGTNDRVWPAANALRRIRKRRVGYMYVKDRYVLVPNAGHITRVPDTSNTGSRNVRFEFGYEGNKPEWLVNGGEPQANVRADYIVMDATLSFLGSVRE